MRIRFFNTYEPVTTFYRDLVPYLASAGNQVEIVISQAEYRPGRNLSRSLGHLERVMISKMSSWGMSPDHSMKKAVVIAAYALHAALHSLLGPGVDRNVFLTQPPLFTLWGYVLSKIRRQSYYCVVMDIYPHVLVGYGVLQEESPVTKILSYLSSLALRKADGVIAIGRCMVDRLRSMGVHPDTIHFIPNWMDERVVYPIDRNENKLRRKWGLEDKFVLLYSGNMGVSHYFDDVLAVAEQLKREKDIVFVFIGDGVRLNEIKDEVRRRHLANVMLKPFQDINMLAHSLSVGDLHLVTLRENFTGLVVPSKSYGILAAGRAILYQGRQDGEIARMILEEDVGSVVQCGNVDLLRNNILKYAYNRDWREKQGHKARELVESKYSRQQALKRYAEVLTAEI
jgi:colanic acid biosynthesis glycosyl transferase WcaI